MAIGDSPCPYIRKVPNEDGNADSAQGKKVPEFVLAWVQQSSNHQCFQVSGALWPGRNRGQATTNRATVHHPR
jgi:hypothetical protein